MTPHTVFLGQGIHRVTLALPVISPPAVNCYVIEGTRGLTLIDCGAQVADRLAELHTALEEICGGAVSLERLICTHMHFDHMGGARTFLQDHPAEFVMHATTAAQVDDYNDWESIIGRVLALARRSGAPPEDVQAMSEWERPAYTGQAIAPTQPVEDGDQIPLGHGRTLQVLHTPGHHQTHICLQDSLTGMLFSGDHVLPRISPFIAFWEGRDTLAEYLDSLERVELLDPVTTLPAHGDTVEEGRGRARQLTLHHQRRLGAMAQVTRSRPVTAWQVMTETFRPDLNVQQRFLAFQETMAHLEHLVNSGRLRRIEENHVWKYHP